MSDFHLPTYEPPDWSSLSSDLPNIATAPAPCDGAAPPNFHATTIFPEYFKIGGTWTLVPASRMDCVVVLVDGLPYAREMRTLREGDRVVVGRTEDGSEGILVYSSGFPAGARIPETFAFRTTHTRETSASQDYDRLYSLLRYEREHGTVVWVLGPSVVFDSDSRRAMQSLIEQGYAHALLAGNALATHDLEAALFGTALGMDVYSKRLSPNGHYHHLDAIAAAVCAGSLRTLVETRQIREGIVAACIRRGVPLVLAGSIRDDGPLPGVIGDVYQAQDAMRTHTSRATTVLTLATQLHAIATGNMTPSYQVVEGRVRPVYFYTVDVAEFAALKLVDRGSLGVTPFVTNVQDFLVNLARNLC